MTSTESSLIKSIFSPEQDYAFEKFCNGENVFISGAGGSGKSFLIRHFVRYLILNNVLDENIILSLFYLLDFAYKKI